MKPPNWWRFASIKTKILAVVLPSLVLGYLVAGVVFLRSERATILSMEEAKSEMLAASLVKSVQSLMVAGHAEITEDWLDELRKVPGLKEFFILRRDGTEAFRDNTTIEEVNRIVGREQFFARWTEEAPSKILSPEKLDRIRAHGGALSEVRGEDLTHIFPIRNEPRCYRCHGGDHKMRGYLLVSTSLTQAKRAIARNQLRLAVLLTLITASVMLILVLLIERLIVRPIRAVADALAESAGDHLAQEIPVNTGDEIGRMAERFNEMARAVKDSQQRLEQWGHRQERLVAEKAQSLREKERQLIEVEKLAALGELAASVVHEINTPVGILISRAEALLLLGEKIGLPPATREHLLALKAQGERIAKTTSDLLNFARRSPQEKSLVDLNEVVRESLGFLESHLRKAGLQVEFLPASRPLRLVANANQLEQVLFNLLKNAQDASPGGGKVTVRICETERGWAEISVEDEGRGIAPGHLNRLFEPFFTTKPRGQGAGLGLVIAKSIVEDHGGRISVERRPGKGSVFRVTLPIKDISHAKA